MANLRLIQGGNAKLPEAPEPPQTIADDQLDDALLRAQERLGIHRDVIEFVEQGLALARKSVPRSHREALLKTLNFVASDDFSLDVEAVDCANLCIEVLAQEFIKPNARRRI